jgi:hypothetical protein
MDRGEHLRHEGSDAGAFDGVAAGASARVGEILSEAEGQARDCDREAARAAQATEDAARADAERLFEEARAEALRVARERVDHLAAIQAKLRTRGPAVLEGLEGSGATRARIEALIEALAAAADDVIAEAEAPVELGGIDPDIRGKDDTVAEEAADAEPEDAAAEPEGADAEPEDAATGGSAAEPEEGADGAEQDGQPLVTLEPPAATDAKGEAVATNGSNGHQSVRYDGPLPDGAPLVRRPLRSEERDARFTALLLALQGHDRAEVEERLCEDYDPEDCARILDEVFGHPADARA